MFSIFVQVDLSKLNPVSADIFTQSGKDRASFQGKVKTRSCGIYFESRSFWCDSFKSSAAWSCCNSSRNILIVILDLSSLWVALKENWWGDLLKKLSRIFKWLWLFRVFFCKLWVVGIFKSPIVSEPEERSGHRMLCDRDYLYVVGGFSNSPTAHLFEVWLFIYWKFVICR